LVKYIFTSEKLSVQVHPNDDEARERGLQRGKNECWYILDAEEGASLGLGLRSSVSADDLRAAARDGSIEQLMDWRPVKAGEFYYVPAGTIHAIGAGITLLEVQQNSDVTYRLYDYGRPRELHLEDGVAVAKPGNYLEANARPTGGPVDTILIDGPLFSLIRTSSTEHMPPSLKDRRRWVIHLQGIAGPLGKTSVGGCLFLEPGEELSMSEMAMALIAVEGAISG
jgi:mannose-6-phosphate isomerase